jgi:hypothetical protein
LRTFHRGLVELCTEARLQTEIVVVEWNPPAENAGIADVLGRSPYGSSRVETRVITVPARIHAGLPHSSKRCLFEYVGKNVGIRRAEGEFILVTNPDTVYSRNLVDRMRTGRLQDGIFYRVDRADVVSPVPENAPIGEVEEYCRRSVLRTQEHWIGDRRHNPSLADYGLHAPAILRRSAGAMMRYRTPVPLHLGAPGDFVLMHRRHWHDLRGFPELEFVSDRPHHLDSLAVIGARFLGLKQEVFGGPCVLYHQEHDRPEQLDKPWTPTVRYAFDAVHVLRKPWPNSDEWGLGDRVLRSTDFGPSWGTALRQQETIVL